jgi:hypothetical protein
MACEKRIRSGSCSHFQCPYPEESGINCVEIFGDCCEVGLDCFGDCEYSYTEGETERIERSEEVVKQRYPEEYIQETTPSQSSGFTGEEKELWMWLYANHEETLKFWPEDKKQLLMSLDRKIRGK